MGFGYFKGKNWIDITREERFYCAQLYYQIKGKELDFVNWLNSNKNMNLPIDSEWEIGFEVCFYREYFHYFRKDSIKENLEYPPKRTFDLCLFGENNMAIIEAKVQQKFETNQVNDFHTDKNLINRLINSKIKVDTILLASSIYYKNYEMYGKKEILENFDTRISWMEMYQRYTDSLFLQADGTYKN